MSTWRRAQSGSCNDDFEGGRDSRVTFTASESGTYYARVSGDRDETGSYTLSVTDVTGQVEAVFVPDPPETELETSPGQSTPGAGGRENVSEGGTDLPQGTTTRGRVDVGGSATGRIGFGGDSDWFRVELEAGKTYQIDIEGMDTNRGNLTDTRLFGLANATGNSISGTADGNGGVGKNARKNFRPNATGTHFVWVASSQGTGTYTLSVIYLGANGASEADTDFPASTSTRGEVDVGGSATGNINAALDHDWFAVELVAGKRYQIDLEGAGTSRGSLEDPWLPGIYDSSSTQISGTGDDDGGEGFNSRMLFTPDATGTYYVAAAEAGEVDLGTYTLSVRDLTPHVEGEVEVDGPGARGTISEPVGPSSANYYTFDYDWFAVTLTAGTQYRIDLEPVIHNRGDGTYYISLLPEIVAIYDADINFLHYTSDRESSGPGYAARVDFTPNASGTYYISASGLGFTSGEYKLTVRHHAG